ncbi:MAG TPA: hypothetical protein DCQ64_15640 [Candidatus Rokubacteria bacterium]|nr:hypothetical protein [Candidatus Rokubacteria bacterium]
MPPPVGKVRAETLRRLFARYVPKGERVVAGPRAGEGAAHRKPSAPAPASAAKASQDQSVRTVTATQNRRLVVRMVGAETTKWTISRSPMTPAAATSVRSPATT